jgi:hypothetical protein
VYSPFLWKKSLLWCADLCGAAFVTPRSMHATPFSTRTLRPEIVFVQLVASIETVGSGSGADHTLKRVRMRGRFPALAKESLQLVAAPHLAP